MYKEDYNEKMKHMKIVAGLGAVDDYETLVNAGADEFFCGYVPYQWLKKYGIMFPLNRREVLYYNVQIGSVSDMKILRRMVEHFHVPVKITLNSLYYTKQQYSYIYEYVCHCMEMGFNTFIIADPGLVLYLRMKKVPCNIHLSGECSEVNREMMALWDEYQIARFIFHRKNTIRDMASCIQNNKEYLKEQGRDRIEYEAFVLNEMCHFTGAYCNSLHCDELTHMCKVPYQLGKLHSKSQYYDEVHRMMEYTQNNSRFESNDYVVGESGCGLCALQQLKEAGVTHLKLVGRGNYVWNMEQDVKTLKKAILLSEQCESQADYEKCMKRELFPNGCSKVCYYNKTVE